MLIIKIITIIIKIMIIVIIIIIIIIINIIIITCFEVDAFTFKQTGGMCVPIRCYLYSASQAI